MVLVGVVVLADYRFRFRPMPVTVPSVAQAGLGFGAGAGIIVVTHDQRAPGVFDGSLEMEDGQLCPGR
jgi:hypothetical protein